MEKGPLISVVIPSFNEERYIGDLLKSVKKQTYKNYEVIISDYHSTDKTVETARSYGARVVNVDRPGVSSAKNEGFKASKGEIVAFIDADYILSKKLFENVVKAFRNDPDTVVVEPTSRVNIKDMNLEQRAFYRLYCRWQNMYKAASFMTPIPSAYGCVFCRREAIDKAGLFNENITINEDREFFSRLRRLGNFKMIRSTVRKSYRRHIKQGILKTELIYWLSFIPAFVIKEVKIPLSPFRGHKRD